MEEKENIVPGCLCLAFKSKTGLEVAGTRSHPLFPSKRVWHEAKNNYKRQSYAQFSQQEAESKRLPLKQGQNLEVYFLSRNYRITDKIQAFEIGELKQFSNSHLHSPESGERQQVLPLSYWNAHEIVEREYPATRFHTDQRLAPKWKDRITRVHEGCKISLFQLAQLIPPISWHTSGTFQVEIDFAKQIFSKPQIFFTSKFYTQHVLGFPQSRRNVSPTQTLFCWSGGNREQFLLPAHPHFTQKGNLPPLCQ